MWMNDIPLAQHFNTNSKHEAPSRHEGRGTAMENDDSNNRVKGVYGGRKVITTKKKATPGPEKTIRVSVFHGRSGSPSIPDRKAAAQEELSSASFQDRNT